MLLNPIVIGVYYTENKDGPEKDFLREKMIDGTSTLNFHDIKYDQLSITFEDNVLHFEIGDSGFEVNNRMAESLIKVLEVFLEKIK